MEFNTFSTNLSTLASEQENASFWRAPVPITHIVSASFVACADAVEIHIPASVEMIPMGVFTNCWSTEVIVLPETLEVEKFGTFYAAHLEPSKSRLSSLFSEIFRPALALKKVVATGLREADKYLIPLDNWGGENHDLPAYVMPKLNLSTVSNGKLKQALVLGYLESTDLYENHEEYHKLLVAQHKALLPRLLKEDRAEAIAILAEAKKITVKNVDEIFLNPAREAGAQKIVAYLENWKPEAASKKKK